MDNAVEPEVLWAQRGPNVLCKWAMMKVIHHFVLFNDSAFDKKPASSGDSSASNYDKEQDKWEKRTDETYALSASFTLMSI